MKLTRTNFFIPDTLLARLRALAKKTERPIVWHVRRAIDEYLRKEQP
jgi:predicted transcriptional regulator